MNAIIIFLVIGAILLSVTGGLGYYFFSKSATEEQKKSTTMEEEQPVPITWFPMNGYDYPGNDMPGSPFPNMTQDQCADKCKGTAGCVAGQYSPSAKFCWLKSNLDASNPNSDRVLMIPSLSPTDPYMKWTLQKNMDHAGDDVACYFDGSSADKCAALCAVHKKCKAYNRVDPAAGAVWTDWVKGGCCVKHTNTPIVPTANVNFYTA
jgi:hypothetical protein